MKLAVGAFALLLSCQICDDLIYRIPDAHDHLTRAASIDDKYFFSLLGAQEDAAILAKLTGVGLLLAALVTAWNRPGYDDQLNSLKSTQQPRHGTDRRSDGESHEVGDVGDRPDGPGRANDEPNHH
ncbi:hypothetical protein Pan189_07390 [Stratiformator vulcanicus]|uniref:Uncharacterized protein n=1 Tax=Stratiformator vulcanicus TaxID=2527980 RepID=A0A517QXQ6_9PLAN|nr:hypothetical protein Pan189_07390 [Stratiformator vulcanicus]